MTTRDSYIIEAYDTGKSTREIAAQLNVCKDTVGKILRKYGRSPRNKSEAQKIALVTGKHPHPTRGTELSEEHRKRIGESVNQTYLDKEENESE